MDPGTKKLAVVFGFGLFFGGLVGSVVATAVTSSTTSETYAEYNARMSGDTRRPPPGRSGAAPRRGGDGKNPHGGGDQRDMQRSIATYHFLRHFLAGLAKKPHNHFPASDWKPLLKDGAMPVSLVEFTGNEGLDFDRMLDANPIPQALARYRTAKQGMMIPMMRAFTADLNQRFGARLTKKVGCTDCHFIDPSDTRKQLEVFPPLMVRFVNALKEPPKNKNPAKNWKPLLKEAGTQAMLCGVCHKTTGQRMEQSLPQWDLSRPDKYADDKAFMVHLMEAWVEKLNRDARSLLVKAVVCLDCHDSDPRR